MLFYGLYNITAASALLPLVTAISNESHAKKGLTWSANTLRMNQIQVIGTHNSYHVETHDNEKPTQQRLDDDAEATWYSQPGLITQLDRMNVRSLEFDIYADPEGGNYAKPLLHKESSLPYSKDHAYNKKGTKVLHEIDIDVETTCVSLVECLQQVKAWLDHHPLSVPISILIEPKTSKYRGEEYFWADAIPWDDAKLLNSLDDEIRSVFPDEQLITPDDVRLKDSTLEESILQHGWPDLDSARGRVFFLMDTDPADPIKEVYTAKRPNLEGRVFFTNSEPGDFDCAFQKINDPHDNVSDIQKQVARGYWVRTRADELQQTMDDCSEARRDDAFESGAQIVSTDFEEYGMSARWGCDYTVKLPGGKPVVCNTVNGRDGCDDEKLGSSR